MSTARRLQFGSLAATVHFNLILLQQQVRAAIRSKRQQQPGSSAKASLAASINTRSAALPPMTSFELGSKAACGKDKISAYNGVVSNAALRRQQPVIQQPEAYTTEPAAQTESQSAADTPRATSTTVAQTLPQCAAASDTARNKVAPSPLPAAFDAEASGGAPPLCSKHSGTAVAAQAGAPRSAPHRPAGSTSVPSVGHLHQLCDILGPDVPREQV